MSIKELIDSLESSPIFAISLSSKELFHSNFWAWLLRRNPAYLSVFFDLPNAEKISREEENRDISVYADGKVYVIENKLKSLPQKDQLLRYQEKLEARAEFGSGVITGIMPPSFICPEKWKFLSYGEIGKRIREISEVEKDEFLKVLIQKYAEMLCKLCEVMTEALDCCGNRLITKGDCYGLTDIKMDDILKKINAEEFIKYLRQSMEKELRPSVGEYTLLMRTDFYNKSAVIDIRYAKIEEIKKRTKTEKRETFVIGVQLQGNQYRRVVQVPDPKTCSDELWGKYKNKNWFWEYAAESRFIAGKKTSMRNRYDRYVTDRYLFLYQYWNITDDSFEALTAQIRKDMACAEKIVADDQDASK